MNPAYILDCGIRKEATFGGTEYADCMFSSPLGHCGFVLAHDDIAAFVDRGQLPELMWGRTTNALLLAATLQAVNDLPPGSLEQVRDAARARRHAREALAFLDLEA